MNKNQETANKLDNMKLSEQARDAINSTDINLFYELFGSLETEEEVEEFCQENY